MRRSVKGLHDALTALDRQAASLPATQVLGRLLTAVEDEIEWGAGDDEPLRHDDWYCGDPTCWICVEDGRVPKGEAVS